MIAAPSGPVPVAVAVLAIDPASRSAWVVARVAVHVIVAPGASEAPAARVQASGDSPVSGSVTWTFEAVTLPLLVTATVYVTTSPRVVTRVGAALLVAISRGA